jgi:hypothetical protein
MASNLRVAELDFDSIKNNLREFLRSKPEFTDYDFEGSGLSVLLDLLAYNTHYNAVIGNMLVQELYLDTAVKKQSIALIAKRLGYVPKSYRAPKAIVDIEVFPTGTPSTLTINKNSRLTTKLNFSDTASFVTRDAVTITANNEGRYIFQDIEVWEGNNSEFRYVVVDPTTQKFEIPSELVDTSLLRVYVQQSLSSTDVEEWINYDSIIDVTSDTKAYFIKLNENLRYEVYFGDGVIGKQLVAGNVVKLDYITTNGPISNGASDFTFADSVDGYTNIVVTTNTAAYGGADPETIDSIRYNAQNAVLAQNRAVTEKDYANVVAEVLPVETVAVFGGETLNPPQYGKIFISAKLIGVDYTLTEQQKTDVITQIKKKSVLSLVHEFIDPEYIKLILDVKVKYSSKKTTLSQSSLKTKIIDNIISYGTTNLNKFDSTFEYSNLVGYIDDIDNSIVSNDTSILFKKKLNILYNVDYQYRFDFFTSLKPSNSLENNLSSTPFVLYDYPELNCYLKDVDGIIEIYSIINNVRTVIVENAGTIDYQNGIIIFNANVSTSSQTLYIEIQVNPNNKNLLPSRNNIITLSSSDITVTLLQQ